MLNFKPLHDRVAIEIIEKEERTSGGIIIPDSAKEKPMQGRVVAVGLGSKNDKGDVIPMLVKVGDIVLYGKWGGTEVELSGKKLMVMKESDIIGIIS